LEFHQNTPPIVGDQGVKEEFDGSLSIVRCFVLLSLWELVNGTVEEFLYPMYSGWVSKCRKFVAVNMFV
jgi:hypothetical protein